MLFFMHIYRNASTIVYDCYRIIFINYHVDMIGVSGKSLVD